MRYEYRQASRADNDAILAFMRDYTMSSALQLRFDRSPDFFALAEAHSRQHQTWLMLRDGVIVAMGSLSQRDGYINGVVEPVAYLSDLRVAPGRAVAGRWRAHFHERMQHLAVESQVRYAFCAVIRDNRLALNSIVRQASLGFEYLAGYATVTVLARKLMRRVADRTVRQASESDLHEIGRLLDSCSRQQAFGVCFDEVELRRRVASWPGLDAASFILALDENDTPVGCVAPWDYSPLKRVIIDALPRGANALRLAFNLLAPVRGRARIPAPPGAILPDIPLSHLAITNRDRSVFGSLLAAAFERVLQQKRAATMSLCLYADDPLWPALNDYRYHAVPMELHYLRIDRDAPDLDAASRRLPGFEFYLA